MNRLTFVLMLLTVLTINKVKSSAEEDKETLLASVIVYRHGDRTPIRLCPNDPYNSSFQPLGPGQLTKEGISRHYQLGQWIRSRYKTFLPDKYSPDDIYVRSTDVDRTIASAMSNLAGLYPPITTNHSLPPAPPAPPAPSIENVEDWQLVPVHVVPKDQDILLGNGPKCPKYDRLYADLMSTDPMQTVNQSLKDLGIYDYVTQNCGVQVDNFDRLMEFYDGLLVESLLDLKLPNWTAQVFPERIKGFYDLTFQIPCMTPSMVRFKMGPFMHKVGEYFRNARMGILNPGVLNPKILMFSAHDTTVANLLTALRVNREEIVPPFAAAIFLELYHCNEMEKGFFVKVLYKNNENLDLFQVPGCSGSRECPLEEFLDVISSIAMSEDQWVTECHDLGSMSLDDHIGNNAQKFLALFGLFLIVVIVVVQSVRIFNKFNTKIIYFDDISLDKDF